MNNIQHFRNKHKFFTFENYSYKIDEEGLILYFKFRIDPNFEFTPKIIIHGCTSKLLDQIPKTIIDNLVFHIGLMEIPSYWKATCSQRIIISAGQLDDFQIGWWKELIIQGMGEFFFKNNINFTDPNFIIIKSDNDTNNNFKLFHHNKLKNKILIPIGGGKDSIVTKELIKTTGNDYGYFSLNPTASTKHIIEIGEKKETIFVTRSIDKHLLNMNNNGYLNGHTPFSAYLAFISILISVLYGYNQVVVSNERSSNEGNIQYFNHEINHQYSKTFTFEKKFRDYIKKYLVSGIEFYSILRPFYELQIAKYFAKYNNYHAIFRSCNRGQKTNSWCESCPKCLATYIYLFPFLETNQLRTVFSTDLFENSSLIDIANKMIDKKLTKPFECVGTYEENIIAFHLCIKKISSSNRPLPVLLKAIKYKLDSLGETIDERKIDNFFSTWNSENFLPSEDIEYLKREFDIV